MAGKVDEFEFFLEKDWSDGFPVVTPTEERVQRMLEGTRRDPDEVVGGIPPALEVATVRTIAIHALMAGCKPEYLPVVLGGTELILREEFNMGGVQCTMHGVAPLMIVNGPYAEKIGIHGGNGCFGPGFRANATIGRAIRLERLLTGIGDAMAAAGSWNMWFASNVVVAMGPQHAKLCADAGMSRTEVHRRLCELGGRRQGDLKRGGNWRPERARAMGVDPDDDECFIKAVKEPAGLHLIVAGGTGPVTAVCHGWNDSSRAVHGQYAV
ncbi:MAG: hypothetical protein HYU44_15890 [Betaproteobacteria bacterium]|nr:hypothetical protein [Betaproteobacteria bacterium]